MRLRSWAGIAAVSAIAAAALVLTGCSTSKPGPAQGGSSPSAANVDAGSLLKQSADDMSKVTGVHVNVVAQGDVPNLRLSKLDGDVSSTPQTVAQGTATVIVGKNNVDAKFVYVDGHLYSDFPDPGGQYIDFGNGSSIYDVSTILDPKTGVANVLAKLKDPKVAGTEQINGIATTKITGTSSNKDIAKLAGSRLAPETEQTIPTTVWIASNAPNHLVRMEITPVTNGTVTTTLSQWGEQVTATKPPVLTVPPS